MEKIKIAITGRVASVAALPEVVADNAEYEVDFALDPREGWDMSLPITALFVRRDGSYTARILDAGETSCTMPPQTGTNIVFVGLTQDDMRTTTPATIKVRRSVRTVANDPLQEPSEDVYAQILAAYAGVKILSGKGAPTSETQGEVNQLYRDEDTQRLYICTATDGGYTWAEVSGGSVDVDATLTKAGQAADAKAAGDAIGKKIDKAQGTGNAGKILGIGADGNVTPQDKPVQALAGASAPTTATAGVVGQEYYVIVNNAVTEMYVCTAVANGTYTWDKVEFGVEIDDTSTEPTKVWSAKKSAEKCNQLSEEIADCIKSPTTAAVGQTIKVSAVDETGQPTEWEAVDMTEQVQSDWNQNDNAAADYVKNRTHYEESIYVDYVLNMSDTEIVGLSMPEVGETMTVKINGVDSAETVKEAESSSLGTSYKYIGNIDFDSLMNGGTGWCVIALPGSSLGFANADTTITVEVIVVHKINDKFINFDGFVRTFDYYFKISTIYKTFYNDNGDECLLYMCDKFILPKTGSQLFGFIEETGFSKVGSASEHSCFVTGFIINTQYGSITVKEVVLGTDTSEMEQIAATYGYTLTTNPKA